MGNGAGVVATMTESPLKDAIVTNGELVHGFD